MIKQSWIRFEIIDKVTAKSAALHGLWVCGIIAGGILIALMLRQLGFNPLGIDEYALIDVGLYSVIGWGIHRMSRVAALSGVVYYALGQVLMWQRIGFKPSALIIVVLFAFANSIRGTFAYHRYSGESDKPTAQDRKESGKESAAAIESEWSCSACGAAITHGQPVCGACGEQLEYT